MRNTKKALGTGEATLPKQPTVRFQVELLESKLHRVATMMAKAGIRTKREFFDYAFSFFEWAIDETAKGNVIGAVLPDGKTFLAWKTPPLETVRLGYEERTAPQKNRRPSGEDSTGANTDSNR